MSVSSPTPSVNGHAGPGTLDDAASAMILVGVERTRDAPHKSTLDRLEGDWQEGVIQGEQDGAEGVDRWLQIVQARDPSRGEAFVAAVARARLGQNEAGEDQEIIVPDRWPILGKQAYHGIVGRIVQAVEPHTEADPAAILIQFLVGFANAVGRKPYWVVGATRHYLAMFVALVGQTASARKGTSWNIVRFFLDYLDNEWAKKRIQGGLSSGEGVIHHVRDEVMGLDKKQKPIVIDRGEKDKRALFVEPELGRTLKKMATESSILSPILREGWDCNPSIANLTKNSKLVATGALISLIGHITMVELGELLSKTDMANGLGNRFLWICARRSKKLPLGGKFHEQNWTPLLEELDLAFDRAQRFELMERCREADDAWIPIYGNLTEPGPGLLGAMMARAEAQVMRLACIYALLDGTDTIRVCHLHAALAVWDYSAASVRFVFGDSMGDSNAEKLLAALSAAPNGLTQTEISNQVFQRHKKKEEIAALLGRLLDFGFIHQATESNGKGRPSTRWSAGSGCPNAH